MYKNKFWSCIFIVCLFLSALSSGESAEIVKMTNTPGQTNGYVDMAALFSMPEVEIFPAIELFRFTVSSPLLQIGPIASLLYSTCVLLLVTAIG